MNKKVAFIAEEYSEKSFTSGGIKLNFEIIFWISTLDAKRNLDNHPL